MASSAEDLHAIRFREVDPELAGIHAAEELDQPPWRRGGFHGKTSLATRIQKFNIEEVVSRERSSGGLLSRCGSGFSCGGKENEQTADRQPGFFP